jgi:serine phosphatase RsbU (regulator of sigma subunit)
MEIWGGTSAVERWVATPGLDLWIYSKPHGDAREGGDIHYVSLCAGGVITRLIVADVAGHGLAVAECSAMLRGLMRKNINRKNATRMIRALNQQFVAQSRLHRFATALVGTYLALSDQFTLCNAGHPRPLWFRASSREWTVLSEDTPGVSTTGATCANLPLGLDREATYDQYALRLSRGDILLFYTDALIESVDEKGRHLGERGLLAMTQGLAMSDPHLVGPALLAGVEAYRGGKPARDDLTILCLYHNANPPRWPSIGETINTIGKLFGFKRV